VIALIAALLEDPRGAVALARDPYRAHQLRP
jgi:hypothetical protein